MAPVGIVVEDLRLGSPLNMISKLIKTKGTFHQTGGKLTESASAAPWTFGGHRVAILLHCYASAERQPSPSFWLRHEESRTFSSWGCLKPVQQVN